MSISKDMLGLVAAVAGGIYALVKFDKISAGNKCCKGKKGGKKGSKPKRWLVYGGKSGWIGQELVRMLRADNEDVHVAEARIDNREQCARELDAIKPTHILNAAGVTGRPNVDWCESHKQETLRTNVIGTMSLIDLAYQRKIHITNFATGCIYEYDDAHKMHSGVGFKEEDLPNFDDSWYSYTKGLVEQFYCAYDNVLNLRLRMPISDDLCHRSFVTKICKYERVVNIPNSMTILSDLLPVAVDMADRNVTGIFNFTNPGVISHNQVLDLYTKYIDPTFTYKNFTLEEQAKILAAGRSNNELDATKLINANPDATIPHILDGMDACFRRMAVNLQKDGGKLPVGRPGNN